ncbi:hypothetical protein EJB05_42546, partial [Eragrostis curvula]
MPAKDGRQQKEPAITAYELQKLRQCMQNNARLQELGLPMMPSMFPQKCGIGSKEKNKKNTNCEGSESEYDPEKDDTGEGDEGEENTSKNTTRAAKKSNKRAADMPPCGAKTRQKRVVAAQPTTRATRSKKSLAVQQDEGSTGFSTRDAPAGEHSEMANGAADNAIDNHSAQQQEEGLGDAESEGTEVRCIRGINMGKGLQKMSRARRGKLTVIIPEGKIRPLVPLVAAKFATECNIAVRNHVPVLKNWREYKKQTLHFKHYLGKLGAKFDIDTKAEPVKKACSQMMKNALRQQRYRLKKKYFDPVPLNMVSKSSPVKSMSDEQWNALVEIWKNPKKMEICEKNKRNRAKVKFHQTTGSRSYMVHCENLGDKYNDEDPNAFDLFKECHYSQKKKGFTHTVQSAIEEMEKKIAEAAEGEEPVSVAEVVADVLAQHTKRNKFLENVGIQDVQPRTSVRNLQEELAEEKRANAELRLVVTTQREKIDVLTEQVHEAEQARVKDKEEMLKMQAKMQKKQADTDAKLELLLSQLTSSKSQ